MLHIIKIVIMEEYIYIQAVDTFPFQVIALVIYTKQGYYSGRGGSVISSRHCDLQIETRYRSL